MEPWTIEDLQKHFDPQRRMVTHRDWVHASAYHTVRYAQLLLERGGVEDCRLGEDIIRRLLSTQAGGSRAEACIFSTPGTQDLNGNPFIVAHLVGIAERADRLPAALAAEWRALLPRAAAALERRWDHEPFILHRDNVQYSNIFLLCVQGMFLLGRSLKDERLTSKAQCQWRRWFNHISYYGIDEFLSPTYASVDREAVVAILENTPDARTREEARLVLDHLYMTMHAIHHPVLGLPICGMSRCYRHYLPPDNFAKVFDRPHVSTTYTPPAAVMEEFAARRYPHAVRGRATTIPFLFTGWQMPDAGMGSLTGGQYYPDNIHLIAAVGRGPDEREILTLPGRHTFRSGFVAQKELRALCLFTRLPQSYNRTQCVEPDAEFDAKVKDKWPASIGVTDGWAVHESRDRLQLHAYGRDLHVAPFAIKGDVGVPVPLIRRRLAINGHMLAERTCYVFPEDTDWYGCAVKLASERETPDMPPVQCRREGRSLIFSWDGLTIRLFLQPSGEVTELHEQDWRTTPLFECPAGTLWPGELTARIANAGPFQTPMTH